MRNISGHVVVGYDGSQPAERAVERAASEATLRNTGLDVLCGWPWAVHAPPTQWLGIGSALDASLAHRDETRAALDRVVEHVRERHPGLPVTATLTDKAAAPTLIDASRDAALTVVGTRGHGGFAGLLLGSVSLRVAAHCEGPLMVVPVGAEPSGERRNGVLVGVKTDVDGVAVRFAFEEARLRAAPLSALHAWLYPPIPRGLRMPPSENDIWEAEKYRKAAEGVAQFAVSPFREEYADVKVSTDHTCADPAATLVAASRDVDLVVLAMHRPAHRLSLQLGPVTHALLHHARCPVVLVPMPEPSSS
ncbi:universal stress protein [Streptomyces iconiensis]|uniref:Universal stress protein n=1 Tax=Streptomyces iconiensis TaxID=1384038 RepID=A0ABT7A2D9_9ACTN|nr:universal stress protein [Streptomyces iconiensis]MDJ1135487.1 universal stress protein [Streptomyces iconiensis]